MSITVRKVTAALLATGLFAFSSAAMATNGYFTHGVGTESKGMAGTGVGSSENFGGIAAATNPALAVFSDEKWQVGLAVFSPSRKYTATDSVAEGQGGAFSLSAGEYDSDNDFFPIPYVARNWKLSNGNSLSFVFYGRGGMNTEWDSGQTATFDPDGQAGPAPISTFPGLYGGGAFGPGFVAAGVDLMQAFLSVNYAMKINDNFAIGIGPVFAAQFFEAKGLPAFGGYTQTFADAALQNGVGAPVPSLTNNGHDSATGFGGAIGLHASTGNFGFGLAYQSKIEMDEFDDYADLFADNGSFDIPSTLKAGVSYQASETFTINFDYERVGYSDVDSVANPIMNLFMGCFTANPAVAPTTTGCFGGPNGGGFGWEDMDIFKFGVVWQADDKNTWRFGYSYGEQPIQSSEVLFNILAPGVMEQHLTVGWTTERASGSIMSFSLMYAPTKEVSGTSSFDPTQGIKLEMSQFELEFAYRF